MNSSWGSGGAPHSIAKSLKSAHVSRWVRRTPRGRRAHCERSSSGRPEKTGAMLGSRTSSGLHDTMRTQGRPLAGSAGKATTLSSTITSGCTSSKISSRRGCTYFAPSISAWVVGWMKRLELLDGGRAEDRRGVADEVLPELARHLGLCRGRAEAHEALLEAARLERAGKRLLEDEHHAVPLLAQHLADADAVVGGAVGTLREEHHRLSAHETRLLVRHGAGAPCTRPGMWRRLLVRPQRPSEPRRNARRPSTNRPR